MRLNHQYFRQKNPPPRLSGARRGLYDDLMGLMRQRRQNPGPGILARAALPDPRMTQSIGDKWKAALERLRKLELREEELEGERRAQRRIEQWRERKKEDPRQKILRQAAAQEIEIREKHRKKVGKKPFSDAKKREMIDEMAQGVAAKWNLLGALNHRISNGETNLVPLRNVVAAEIEGYLTGPALEYSLSQALSELTAAQVSGIKNLLAQKGLTAKDILLEVSDAQVLALKKAIESRGLSFSDRRLISKDPQIQRAFLTSLKHKGVKITREQFLEIVEKDPKELGMILAFAVSKDPAVMRAVKKLAVMDEIRARVDASPDVLRAKAKVQKAQAKEHEDEEISRKASARQKMRRSQTILESEHLARKEAQAFADKDPLAVAFRRRDIPDDLDTWNRVTDTLTARSKKLLAKESERAKKLIKIFSDYDHVLKRQVGTKELKEYPYIPSRFIIKNASRIEAQERIEDGRILAILDDEVAQQQLRSFREKIKRDTGSYPRIDSIRQYREYLVKRLYAAVVTRWRNALMLGYEDKGGKYLTPSQQKIRERALKKELGAAFAMGGGLFGIVIAKGNQYKWKVFAEDGEALMWGISPTHATASRQLVIAHRVVYNILQGGFEKEPGFDYLPATDRKWLSANLPDVSIAIKRILLASAGEKIDLDAKTMRWLAQKEAIEESMPISLEGYQSAKDCSGMNPGEKRVIKIKGATILVERGKTEEIYKTQVLGKDGEKSAVYRFKNCAEVLSRASMIAGALAAGKKVIESVGNPASMKRLSNSATKYLSKQKPKRSRGAKKKRGRPRKNPIGGGVKLPRKPAQAGAIEDLSGMIGLPDDAESAYRLGYYSGIIKGIDTCGIQNWARRKRLRKEFTTKLLEAVVYHQESLTEPSMGRRGRSQVFKSKKDDWSSWGLD